MADFQINRHNALQHILQAASAISDCEFHDTHMEPRSRMERIQHAREQIRKAADELSAYQALTVGFVLPEVPAPPVAL